tara:strand:- start:345 stop:920 length:576 start_codon:yes stop_codon:yes gene_type:complete
MRDYRHKRFYRKSTDKKVVPKLHIKAGMIIEFQYMNENNKKSRPLVFVMDTDEFRDPSKKTFSGVNLNYLPFLEVEKFFVKLLGKAGWELDKHTKLPKVDIWEEDDAGIRSIKIYNSLVKKSLLKRYDCWRTYKYKTTKSAFQIKYHFLTNPLSGIYDKIFLQEDNTSKVLKKVSSSKMYSMLREVRKNED